ncbi:MAG: 4Fe-4S binding protein [Verrucomicrobiota bacterium]
MRAPGKIIALQLYRLGILALIVWLVRDHHVRLRIDGDLPITADEARGFLPTAAQLRTDHSAREGMFVLDANGAEIGYVIRTSPKGDAIIGYAGPTDTLIVLDKDWKVLGIKIRRSDDTHTHVGDVAADKYFMKTWNGMTWERVAEMDLQKAGVEGVSGATLTSMAMAEAIVHRFKSATDALAAKPQWRVRVRDIGTSLVVCAAIFLCLTHVPGRKWIRRVFQVLVIVYVGFVNGDLLAQSLLMGWAKAGVPWTLAPGLVLLAVAAFIIPWTTKKPLYCLHICPHGAAQELLGRVLPEKYRLKIPGGVLAKLRWLPGLLLGVVLIVVMLALPLDLASVEAFDAYLIKSAGVATVAIAIAGLVAALFVPQAYCRFGCPTGALLEFVRSHGQQDRFGARDIAAACMVALVAVLYWKYDAINAWIIGPML